MGVFLFLQCSNCGGFCKVNMRARVHNCIFAVKIFAVSALLL